MPAFHKITLIAAACWDMVLYYRFFLFHFQKETIRLLSISYYYYGHFLLLHHFHWFAYTIIIILLISFIQNIIVTPRIFITFATLSPYITVVNLFFIGGIFTPRASLLFSYAVIASFHIGILLRHYHIIIITSLSTTMLVTVNTSSYYHYHWLSYHIILRRHYAQHRHYYCITVVGILTYVVTHKGHITRLLTPYVMAVITRYYWLAATLRHHYWSRFYIVIVTHIAG